MRKTQKKIRADTANVLIVQSDPKKREVIADLIGEVSKCRIDVMSRLGADLEWISGSNYHLVVIDLAAVFQEEIQQGNRKSDSLVVLERIKRASPATSVIVVAKNANIAQAVEAIRLGAEDYFEQSFNLESFKLAVKRGLDRKILFSENSEAAGFINLLNSCQMISAALDQNKIFGIVRSFFSKEVESKHAAIYLLKDGSPVRLEAAATDPKADRAVEEMLDISVHAVNPFENMISHGDSYKFVDRSQLTPGLFIVRFRCAGDQDYFCVCLSPKKPKTRERMEDFESHLELLKKQTELSGKNIKQYMGVQHLVYVDDATGLYNTRYLNFILDREINHSHASKHSFAVLFVDADRFKKVNDIHGHLVGTKLLNELGRELKKYVRDTDTVFRYGGDEFVAVLSPCDIATAQTVAERIRASVERTPFLKAEGNSVRFTVSIGVALFPDHATTKKDIIDLADNAMYEAKKRSRNTIVVYPTLKKKKVIQKKVKVTKT